MLQDMRHARVVGRVCLEPDGEDIVAVVAGNVEMFGAGLVVLQMQRRQLQLRNLFRAQKSEAMKLLAWLWVLRELRDSSSGSAGSASSRAS